MENTNLGIVYPKARSWVRVCSSDKPNAKQYESYWAYSSYSSPQKAIADEAVIRNVEVDGGTYGLEYFTENYPENGKFAGANFEMTCCPETGRTNAVEYRPSKDGGHRAVTQDVVKLEDVVQKDIKVQTSSNQPCHSTKRAYADGGLHVQREMGDKFINYEIKPTNRKLLKGNGIAAKLEKYAMKIGTDANGCERPVLRRVAGLMISLARRGK